MLAKIVFLCIACVFAAAQEKTISVTGCGGDIQAVRATPCDSEPCAFKKGDTTVVEVDFVSNQDTETLKLTVSARIFGRDMEFPGMEGGRNGCEESGLSCPLVKGGPSTFKFNLEVPQKSPTVASTTATFKLEGSDGVVFCFKAPVQLK